MELSLELPDNDSRNSTQKHETDYFHIVTHLTLPHKHLYFLLICINRRLVDFEYRDYILNLESFSPKVNFTFKP